MGTAWRHGNTEHNTIPENQAWCKHQVQTSMHARHSLSHLSSKVYVTVSCRDAGHSIILCISISISGRMALGFSTVAKVIINRSPDMVLQGSAIRYLYKPWEFTAETGILRHSQKTTPALNLPAHQPEPKLTTLSQAQFSSSS